MELTRLMEEEPPAKSFFIPIGLSPFQKDLTEILIKLHKNSIIEQLSNESLSYNTTDDSEDQKYLRVLDLNTLFKRNMLSIQNHPYLLVEHYMPKKLLLMESHERLMVASDKFNTFDKLITTLKEQRLNLIVVGHNIKELDLIEGFIMGRQLSYKRYSGRKLYDDVDTEPNEEVNAEKKLNKDSDDYTPKPKPRKIKNQLSLHLITTQQLYNTSFQNIDGIISFDPSLNERESSIEYLRSIKDEYVPLIKLLVLGTDYHAELCDKVNEFDSLVDRNKLDDSVLQYRETLGTNLLKIGEYFNDLKEQKNPKWPSFTLPSFKNHTKEEIIQSLNDLEFIKEEEPSSKKVKLKLEEIIIPDKLTIKDYKNLLTKLSIERITKIENKISENRTKLDKLRAAATSLNNSEDDLKLKVGAFFKESKDLKEQVIGAEKKHERLQLEFENLNKTEKELQSKTQESRETNEEDADTEIKELETLLESLKTSNDETEAELGSLRSTYQETTSNAAELSTTFKTIKAHNDALSKKLNNESAIKLRSLKNEEIKLNQKDIIERLNNEVRFLQVYKERLEKVVKEKVSTLNVGRNGRVHRSTTPYTA